MAQVSIGQVENLEELARGLLSMRESLESACREQIALVENEHEEARVEAHNSAGMLETARQEEIEAQQALCEAQEATDCARDALDSAELKHAEIENHHE